MPSNHQIWQQWKLYWTSSFNDQHDIQKLTKGGNFTDQANIATETNVGEKMVASLDNLESTAVHNNDTVRKIVMYNRTLTDSIASIQTESLKLIKIFEM